MFAAYRQSEPTGEPSDLVVESSTLSGSAFEVESLAFPSFAPPSTFSVIKDDNASSSGVDWLACSSFQQTAPKADEPELVKRSSSESSAESVAVSEEDEEKSSKRRKRKHRKERRKKRRRAKRESSESPEEEAETRRRSKKHSRRHDGSEATKAREGAQASERHDMSRPSSSSKQAPPVKAGVGMKEKTVFLDVVPLPALTSNASAVYVDTHRDLETLQFGTFYKRHVAKFAYRRRVCLGASNKLSDLILAGQFAATKKSSDKLSRYFAVKKFSPSSREYLRPLKENKNQAKPSVLPDFLPIDISMIKTSEAGQIEYLIFDETTGMYRNVPRSSANNRNQDELDSVESLSSSLADSEVLQENKRLNQLVSDDPHNVELWVDFINHQDKLCGTTSLGSTAYSSRKQTDAEKNEHRLTTLGLLERKISIIDKALSRNPKCLRLMLLRMKLGQEFWDREKIREEWRKLEFLHVNQPELWFGYLSYAQRSGANFRTSRHLELFGRCIEKLEAVRSGRLASHPPGPFLNRFFVYVFALTGLFLKNAGYTEKMVALMQAVLEYNLFMPASIAKLSQAEKRAFFEPFWDSLSPRFGDDGALGWDETLKQQLSEEVTNAATPGFVEFSLDEQEDEVCKRQDLPASQVWTVLELLRTEYQWKPWRCKEEQPEDLDRIVAFDDIKGYLIEFEQQDLKFYFVSLFLELLGASLLQTVSSSISGRMQLRSVLGLFDAPLLSALDVCSLNGMDAFISNCLKTCARAFDEPYRTYFVACSVRNEAQTLSANKTISVKEKYQALKKFAKDVLKEETNRGSLILFLEYARCLAKLGKAEEAISTVETALSGHLVDKWLNLPSDSTQLIAILAALCFLLRTKLSVAIEASQNLQEQFSECAKLIASVVCDNRVLKGQDLRAIQGSAILRAKNILKAKAELHFEQLTIAIAEGKFRASFGNFWAAPLGLVAVNLNVLCSFAQFCTGDASESSSTKCATNLGRLKGTLFGADDFCLQFDSDFACLDRNLEKLTEFNCELAAWRFSRMPFAPLAPLRAVLKDALLLYPLNVRLLKNFIDVHLRGELMMQLRRFFDGIGFNSTATAGFVRESEVFWLAAISAELNRLNQIRQAMTHDLGLSSEAKITVGEVNRIRHLLERAAVNCMNPSVLWRLWIEFEFIECSNNVKAPAAVFYQAVRQFPGLKELYIEAARKRLVDVSSVVDLMTQREIRVRLPYEELEVLMEAANRPIHSDESEASEDEFSEPGDRPVDDMHLVEADSKTVLS